MACHMCYRSKSKCEFEGSNSACTLCMRRNVACVFDSENSRESYKRKQYIRSLEDRLSKTESLLKNAGILDQNASSLDNPIHDDADHDRLENDRDIGALNRRLHKGANPSPSVSKNSISWPGYPAQTARPSRNANSPSMSGTPSSAQSRCSPMSSSLQHVPIIKANDREDSRYFGRSSSMSILSKHGIEWIKERTGDIKFLNAIFSGPFRDRPWDYWRPDVFHDLFASRVYKPLPPRAEVFSLLRDYFRTVNRLFPLYHEATFMRLIEWQYTQQTCDDAARWASINVLLALAYEYRFSNSLKPERDREKAWLYFKNAMSCFTELTFRRTDLLSLQALLGLAIFLRGNSGTQTALPIITAALRSCHRMGLHRAIPRPDLSPTEQEQRRKVFWVAYVLDQSTCVRMGNAPLQHPDDFDVDFPQEAVEGEANYDNDESPSSRSPVVKWFFRELCRLTVIKGRIYFKLYSTKSSARSPAELCADVHELEVELEEWKRTCPIRGHCEQDPAAPDFLQGFASIGLRLVHYNCQIMIHRIPPLMNITLFLSPILRSRYHSQLSGLENQSSLSRAVCLRAARDSLKLLNSMPWGDMAWVWSLLYYILLAVITIFVNILRNSMSPHAREDLHSLNMAATFFATLVPADGPYTYATFMAKLTANFERLARVVIDREEKKERTTASSEHPHPHPPPRRTRAPQRQQPNHPFPSHPHPHPHPHPPSSAGYNGEGENFHHTTTTPISTNTNPLYIPEATTTTPYETAYPITPDNTVLNSHHAHHPSHPPSTPSTVIPPPECWQIPLTADWELALFGNQFGWADQLPYALDQSSVLDGRLYGYGGGGGNGGGDGGGVGYGGSVGGPMSVAVRDPLSGGRFVWMDGFLDSY